MTQPADPAYEEYLRQLAAQAQLEQASAPRPVQSAPAPAPAPNPVPLKPGEAINSAALAAPTPFGVSLGQLAGVPGAVGKAASAVPQGVVQELAGSPLTAVPAAALQAAQGLAPGREPTSFQRDTASDQAIAAAAAELPQAATSAPAAAQAAPASTVAPPSGGGVGGDPVAEAAKELKRLKAEGRGLEDEIHGLTKQQAEEDLGTFSQASSTQAQRDLDYAKDMQKLRERADGMLATRDRMLQEYRDGAVDPDKFMKDMGDGAKVATALGALASGFLVGTGVTQTNHTLDWLDKSIERSIQLQREGLRRKLDVAQEAGASFNQTLNLMDHATVAENTKREAFWKSVQRKMDQTAMKYKIPIDDKKFAYVRNELDRRVLEAQMAARQAAINAAAKREFDIRQDAAKAAEARALKASETPGAEPVNVALLTEQGIAARTGRPMYYKNPQTGKVEVLPPSVASSPEKSASLKPSEEKIEMDFSKEAESAYNLATAFDRLGKINTMWARNPTAELSAERDLLTKDAFFQLKSHIKNMSSDSDRAVLEDYAKPSIFVNPKTYEANTGKMVMLALAGLPGRYKVPTMQRILSYKQNPENK